MVNERIIPLNVKPVEEVMFVDEDKITPVYERTYIIVYKPAPRTPTPPPKVPTPPPRIPTPPPPRPATPPKFTMVDVVFDAEIEHNILTAGGLNMLFGGLTGGLTHSAARHYLHNNRAISWRNGVKIEKSDISRCHDGTNMVNTTMKITTVEGAEDILQHFINQDIEVKGRCGRKHDGKTNGCIERLRLAIERAKDRRSDRIHYEF